MPIVGLTGRGARIPEIGKLFKGAKKEKKVKDGREYETFGKELDYWRFESNDPQIVEAFNKAFAEVGGKPQEIPVYLPFSRTEENFEAWQEAYTAGGLAHRCDGRECVLWLDEKSGTYHTDPKPCPALTLTAEKAKRDGCKPVARLRVVIPALNQLGCVVVETHSKNDILHLDAALPAYETLRPEGLRGIPMLLRRVQKSISTPGDGKRARRSKWLIELKPHPEWAALYLDAQRQGALAAVAETRLLTTDLAEEEEEDENGQNGHADPRQAIIERMRSTFTDTGKADKWPEYEVKHLNGKTLEKLNVMLFELETRAWTAIFNEINGPIFNALKAADVDDVETLERITLMADSEAPLEKLDYATLVTVRDGLAGWLESLKKEAAKAA